MGTKSGQCYDSITPHDMYSSANCALSGALVLGGGWCVACWILLRSLSLHLQICWQVVPGRRFFLAAQAIGWSVPVVFLAIALGVTGVSFRFGDSCHINSKDSLKTFWGPLLGTAAASVITQVITYVGGLWIPWDGYTNFLQVFLLRESIHYEFIGWQYSGKYNYRYPTSVCKQH